MECKKKENLENCTCDYPCERKGLCCDCVSYHKSHGGLPACLK